MNERRPLPPQAAPGQTYGKAAEQVAAQRAVPIAPARSPAPAPPAGGGRAAVGGLVPLDAPTQRPGEPLTSGIAGGPGPGPEALQLPGQDLVSLVPYLPALELMAGQPGASVAARNLVRRVRGAVPAG